MKLSLTAIWSLLLCSFSFAQTDFASPLDIPLLLSGNFGELRPNHFHAGVDFKTQGREGLNIYAIKEGYVSRIKVGAYGYGKALYITHPNGYTSVYAHLQKFAPVIETYIKKRQYNRKSFEIDAYPKENELVIKKGQVVGLGGNTGSSAGPHLHFEIRDANSNALNPLLYGYEIKDNIPPDVYQVMVYPLGKEAQVNQSQLPQVVKLTKQADGSYLADKILASGAIGFGLQSIDKQNDTHHQNGVYKVSLAVNGETHFQYVFDKLSFNEARYINTFIDYQTYVEKKSRVQLLYRTKGNRISTIYTENKNEGQLDVQQNTEYLVTIVAEDIKGNISKINIPLEGKNLDIKEARPMVSGEVVIAGRDQYFTFDGGNVYFPERTFYEDFLIQIESKNDTLTLHNPATAVHKFFNLSFNNKKFSEKEAQKVFIARLNEKNKPSAERTIYKNGLFTTRTRNLGRFTLMKDTIAPTLRPLNFKNNATVTASTLKVEIKDDLSGVESYSATLNGQWILFEYEPKTQTLTFDFSDIDTKKTDTYRLEMIAKDGVGNVQKLDISFKKK
ncbi:M23 family metallopeptidase [Capnocytophaga cynodegmi]|uniref:Putative lysostaphin n=1 Tax=Capnocytophaga cynodegmi TaxID=28189 RepID=A0A0B7HDX8_9FLAO|nr:M23 family metallopeptidase [Capnocytophaga cynodegmi]CEN36839.1 putative lysostaphin [Capnocytophaga cynodegmi]CEN42188.1 putative lysostaphin [Capnocytophaga cynodegmi]